MKKNNGFKWTALVFVLIAAMLVGGCSASKNNNGGNKDNTGNVTPAVTTAATDDKSGTTGETTAATDDESGTTGETTTATDDKSGTTGETTAASDDKSATTGEAAGTPEDTTAASDDKADSSTSAGEEGGQSSEVAESATATAPDLLSYEEIIALYADYREDPDAFLSDSPYSNLISTGFIEVNLSDNPVGYVLEDISGDGEPELVIAVNESMDYYDGSRVLAVYGMRDGRPVMLLEGWARNRAFILENGSIYREGSSGADNSCWQLGELPADGSEYRITKYVYSGIGADGQAVAYANADGVERYESSELLDVPMTEAFEEGRGYLEVIRTFELKPFKEVNRHWMNNADISWIDPEKPMVALSFDDGPVNPVNDNSSAIRIQNALAENGMHATFFYWGNSLNNNTKKELERAYELGFELGNHTKTHPDLSKLEKGEIEAEVAYIDKILKSITGQEQFLVRPPYLAVNKLVKETINVPLISSGLDSQDWNKATTEEIIEKITKAAENGTLDGKIVLMHETYKTTAEAVEYLVPYLKEQGYQVVTISEMFKVRGREMEAGIVYTQCGK